MQAPYAVALAAGLVAAFNPCGFALLPAYLALVLGDQNGSSGAAVRRALGMSAAMTAGFVAVFGAFGLVVVPLALAVEQHLPWVTVVIGIALAGMGVWLAAGRQLTVSLPRMRGGAPAATMLSMVGYGVAYAVASLSCTIGPFLALTSTTFTNVGLVAGVAIFVTYAIGMGLVIGVLAVAVALARGALVGQLRRVIPYVSRASGVLMIVAGAYVVYYGIYELRLFSGQTDGQDPVVGAAVEIQGIMARWVQAVDPWWWVFGLAVLVGVGELVRRSRASTRETASVPGRTLDQ